MLRKTSRTSRQAKMADSGSLPSPTEKYKIPFHLSSSPKLFTNFTSSKGFSETEAVISPTSILDTKPFFGLRNPFWSEANVPKTPESETRRHWDKLESKGIGLAIVDALIDEKHGPEPSKSESRMVLFGSQLKIQIPPLPSSVPSLSESPRSLADFGTKTKNSQLGSSSSSLSQSPMRKSGFRLVNSGSETINSSQVFTGCLSASEMESSEDYTRVVAHGPNPRTTHIFDNCIIQSCCFGVGFSESPKENGFLTDQSGFPSDSFLSFCYNCKKNLEQGKDIYMYRGEKAFCSRECRCQEIMLEEGIENLGADDVYGSCS
ncbi:protein MARD1 [Quillaja saponaria]|uniref:Protein MARD1 n=1 Tax=Quillaja saponaria TaxID=32244 RepID=A0AAD7VLN7_QUISA|nr:protein MARD1 [Quillaja saponaria]